MSDAVGAVVLERLRKTFARERDPKSLYRALRGSVARSSDSVIALESVTCTIRSGEKVGVIGDNGSGKTTLLKLIAGLYRPTAGRVEVNGEITLVTGLGIGMVDEATVEENVFLYGAIYGIERREMRGRLSEILAWAELGDFARARLKTLSTGMRSRLAFAAMRHVDTDVYLMDEVLSAGDMHFVKKCEAVFDEYRRSEKTFVVATHNVRFMREFCDRVLWFQKGKQMAFGEPDRVTDAYAAFTET